MLWQVQCVEREPFCKAPGAIILMKLDAGCVSKDIVRKGNIEDRQKFVSLAAFMGVDVFHEEGGVEDCCCDTEFFAELPNNCGLGSLTEIDRAAEGADALHPSSVIQNFGSQKPSATPVEPKSFETDTGCGTPCCH